MAGLVPVYLNTIPNTPDGLRELAELPLAKTLVLVNAPVRQSVFNSSMSSSRILTTSNSDLLQDPDWWSLVSADPAQEWTW